MLVNKFLINLRKQWDWTQNFLLCAASVSDCATVNSRGLTSKLIKAIMSAVDKDVQVFMEELKESFVFMHLSVKNQ